MKIAPVSIECELYLSLPNNLFFLNQGFMDGSFRGIKVPKMNESVHGSRPEDCLLSFFISSSRIENPFILFSEASFGS